MVVNLLSEFGLGNRPTWISHCRNQTNADFEHNGIHAVKLQQCSTINSRQMKQLDCFTEPKEFMTQNRLTPSRVERGE